MSGYSCEEITKKLTQLTNENKLRWFRETVTSKEGGIVNYTYECGFRRHSFSLIDYVDGVKSLCFKDPEGTIIRGIDPFYQMDLNSLIKAIENRAFPENDVITELMIM